MIVSILGLACVITTPFSTYKSAFPILDKLYTETELVIKEVPVLIPDVKIEVPTVCVEQITPVNRKLTYLVEEPMKYQTDLNRDGKVDRRDSRI